MRQLSSTRKYLALIIMALLLAVAMPSTSLGQGRHGGWRNRGDRDNWNWSRNRKCGKFVNCHDARDGRWDGRGPRGSRVGNRVWWNGNQRYGNNVRYRRYRSYDNTRYWWRRYR